jgi:SAM-dependent methyltransferase
VLGVDISPGMIAVARDRVPHLDFRVGSMRRLPCEDGSLAAIVAFYSLIHLDSSERADACHDFARALRPGGWVLAAFHLEDADHRPGEVSHLDAWFGSAVDLDFHFLDPDVVQAELAAAGFDIQAQLDREPIAGAEHPSRRCYLLVRRR